MRSNGNEIKKQLININMAEKPISINLPEPERIVPMNNPTMPINIHQWRSIIIEHYPISITAAESALSITAQLLINDVHHPFPLVLIGPPSSGKTTVLNFFNELDGVSYTTDGFTSSALVSMHMGTKKSELSKNDLLPRMRRKVVLVRDMSVLFSKRDEDLRDLIGKLTRVFDGEGLVMDSGPHGERGYIGDYSFMMLAASTPIRNRVWRLMGSLGSRFFFQHFPTKTKNDAELANQLAGLPSKTKEHACREATTEIVRTLWQEYPTGIDWLRSADPDECLNFITQCGRLLSCLRSEPGTLQHDGNKKFIDEFVEPNIEQPDRVINLLYNFARGHALACGRTQLTEEDLPLILRISLDSTPPTRMALIRALITNKGSLNTEQAQVILGKANQLAGREMEILRILGICKSVSAHTGVGRPHNTIEFAEGFTWLLSERFIDIYNQI